MIEKLLKIAKRLNVKVITTTDRNSCYVIDTNTIYLNGNDSLIIEVLAHELGHVAGVLLGRQTFNTEIYFNTYDKEELIADLIAVTIGKTLNFNTPICKRRSLKFFKKIDENVMHHVNTSVELLIGTH